MFGSLFRYKGTLWHVLNNITDVLGLSMLWVLCSLPVITLGAATTALYDSVVHCVRYGQEGPYRRFFRTFRNELPVSALSTLLWGLIAFCGSYMLRLLSVLGPESRSAALAVYAYFFVLMLLLGICCWVFPLLSRFSFGFVSLNLTALRFAFAHLFSTIALVVLTLFALWASIRYILALLVAPAMLMLLWSLPIERAFAKHGGAIERAVDKDSMDALNED